MRDKEDGNRLNGRRQYLPAGIVLLGVSVFWVVGIFGGLRVLHSPVAPLSVLIWLYVMLAAVALSAVAAALAITDISRRFRRRPRPAVEEHARELKPSSSPDSQKPGSQKPGSQKSSSQKPSAQRIRLLPGKKQPDPALMRHTQSVRHGKSMQDTGRRVS